MITAAAAVHAFSSKVGWKLLPVPNWFDFKLEGVAVTTPCAFGAGAIEQARQKHKSARTFRGGVRMTRLNRWRAGASR